MTSICRSATYEGVATPLFERSGPDVAFWALFGVFALGEAATRIRSLARPDGRKAARGNQVVVVLAVVGSILGGLGLASWDATAITTGQWPLFVVGLISMAAGIVLRQLSIATLGRSFTSDIRLHTQQTVVDSGPYHWLRHPSYSGLIMFFIGFGFAMTNWMALIVLATVPTSALIARVLEEEKVLIGGLGDDYRRYAAGRKRLFPHLW